MKIGIWLSDNFNEQIGGGYSYYHQLVNSIDKWKFSSNIEIAFITKVHIETKLNNTIIKLNPIFPNYSIKRKIINYISRKIPILKKNIEKKIIEEKIILRNSEWIKVLKNNDIDLIYYPYQAQCEINDFPYIATIWDVGHKSTFAFPELTNYSEYESREQLYIQILNKALFVFSESETGKDEIIHNFKIYPERIKIVPIFPGRVIELNPSLAQMQKCLNKYNLKQFQYYYYPAQFWSHKNHYNLILAFALVIKTHPDNMLVLSGADQGNLSYIKKLISELKLEQRICLTGFISDIEVNCLYRNAIALVYPSFLGPTNMPLLEAIHLNCPVLCSNLLGHMKLLGNNAIFFDPASYVEISEAMLKISDKGFRNNFLADIVSNNICDKNSISNALNAISRHFDELTKIRNCWE